MKVIVTEVGGGKTTALINWMFDGEPLEQWPYWSRVIVTPDRGQADYVRCMIAEREGHPIPEHAVYRTVISARELSTALFRVPVEFAVDNADAVLRAALGVTPAVVSMTGEFRQLEADHAPHAD